MSIWAQIGDQRVTAVPPDGRSVISLYADFEFGNDSVPEGTQIIFLVGKGAVNEDSSSPADIEASITPLNGVELFDNKGIVEERIVRNEAGNLVIRKAAKVSLRPISDGLKDSITIVAYSTFDKIGTAKRLAFDSADLTVSGGEGIFLASVERYDPVLNIWEDKEPMPTGRSGLFCETVGTKVYAIGGFAGNFLPVCEEYSPATDAWVSKSPMSIARGFGSSAVVGGKIYIIGGYNFDPTRATSVVERYNPVNDTWDTMQPLPFPIAFSVAQAVGSDIWVFYGAIEFDDLERVRVPNSSVLRYDTVGNTWTLVDSDFSTAILTSLSSAAAAGDFLLQVPNSTGLPLSGTVTINRGAATAETIRYTEYENGKIVLSSSLAFAHLAGETVDQASLPRRRLGPNCFFDGVSLIKIFNGFSENAPLGTVEEYDISSSPAFSSITTLTPSLPRIKAGQALIGSDLYIVGGSGKKSDFLDEVEKVETLSSSFSGPAGFAQMKLARTSMGICAGNDGAQDYVFSIGGQGSGHEAGWLKMEVESFPEEIRADGKEMSSIVVTAEDASGDPPPDGTKFKVRGLIYISKTSSKKAQEAAIEQSTTGAAAGSQERNPPPSISVLPVLFSAKDIVLSGGSAATVLLDRSEDMINEVQNLINFVKGNERVPGQESLKRAPSSFENFKMTLGEKRALYNVAIEVTVDDPFFFGQTDSDAAAAEIPNTPLASSTFSFNPPISKQGRSGSVGFFSDITSIPDVQLLTEDPVDATEAEETIESLKDEIPFGASPHYDAIVAGARARILPPPPLPLAPPINLMISASDNENSGSSSSAEDVVEEVNLVDGLAKFPVFITTFVVTDPISLSARKARTDVEDLELISSETGGNSFFVAREEYLSFVIDRIKTSAPASIGSGTFSVLHEIDGRLASFGFVVDNMIAGNSAEMTVSYSNDGYNFTELGISLMAAEGAGSIVSNSVLATPIEATKIRYTIRLASKSFSSPVLKSASLQFIVPNIQHLFTFPQSVNGQITELAAVTNERLPSGGKIEVGFVHGKSMEFDPDYVSATQPAAVGRGTIMAVNREFDAIIEGQIFRDILDTSDFVIYRSRSGPWAQDATTRVFVNEIEALPGEFIQVAEEGAIVFRRKLAPTDKVGVEVQNPAQFRVGLKITNPSLNTGVLDSFAFMWGESQQAGFLKPNRAPRATNLFISPSPVLPGGPIEANYTFVDPDGDPEDKEQTEIIWFRNGAPVSELTGKRTVSNQDILAKRLDGRRATLISRGQEWFFAVRPSDGRAFGPLAVSHPVKVANVPPSATNAKLVSSNADPLLFTSKDTITAEFDFKDTDEDKSIGSFIAFFVDGLEIKSGTENTLSPDETDDAGNRFISAGKSIRADIIPSDGKDFGVSISTQTVTVESSPPVVTDVSVLPTEPSPTSSLRVTFKFVDLDKDRDQSTIAWFANDVRQSSLDNLAQVPAGTLKPGQKWFAVVTPFDGQKEGEPVKSNVVLVQF